jgi:hypothetical protein
MVNIQSRFQCYTEAESPALYPIYLSKTMTTTICSEPVVTIKESTEKKNSEIGLAGTKKAKAKNTICVISSLKHL